jgi:sulfite reductase (NADPH) flavoprotein alpha-component
MMENAAEMWKWLEEGAYFYVCGDASRMAKDVDDALRRIVVQAGGKSEEQAAEYVEEMKKSKRYRKDVY